mmetsp:Transcript_60812/g.146355  ORF Transcript_60812/g.146355 Transcript_60812/m.146355 type:complete len:267 (+) Transcript_60812:1642-2442(+)
MDSASTSSLCLCIKWSTCRTVTFCLRIWSLATTSATESSSGAHSRTSLRYHSWMRLVIWLVLISPLIPSSLRRCCLRSLCTILRQLDTTARMHHMLNRRHRKTVMLSLNLESCLCTSSEFELSSTPGLEISVPNHTLRFASKAPLPAPLEYSSIADSRMRRAGCSLPSGRAMAIAESMDQKGSPDTRSLPFHLSSLLTYSACHSSSSATSTSLSTSASSASVCESNETVCVPGTVSWRAFAATLKLIPTLNCSNSLRSLRSTPSTA